MKFAVEYGKTFSATAFLLVMLLASYRKLWKNTGFWMLLVACVGGYGLTILNVADGFRGLQMAVLCGVVASGFGSVFAGIIAVLYHRGPQPPRWLRPARPPSKIASRDWFVYIGLSIALVIGITLYAFHAR